MKRERIGLVLAYLAFSVVITPSEAAAQDLPAEGSRIVNELVDQWKTRFRSTDLALAMSNLGVPADDDLRLQGGAHLRANTSLARPLRTWGANNYILSNDEKVIAKYLISFFEDKKQMPTLGEAEEATGVPKEDLSARLEFMARAGFLKKTADTPIGFSLGEDYETWGGPLRYNFHTVSVEGEKAFGVW